MKRRANKCFGFCIGSLLLLLMGCGLWMRSAQQQYDRNRNLIAALVRNDTRQALELVNAGANPNTLYDAPHQPNPTLSLLLNQWLHPTSPPANDSLTAFMLACSEPLFVPIQEDLPLLRAMLAHGANIHARTTFQRTALQEALCAGRFRTVELLLQHGADVNAQDKFGLTPLMLAVTRQSRIGETHRSIDVLQLLLDHHANVNSRTPSQLTPLMLAAKYGYLDNAKMLLKYGADIDAVDENGNTALILAIMTRRPAMVRLLLSYHPRVNVRNKRGYTLFEYARWTYRSGLIHLLEQAGAKR